MDENEISGKVIGAAIEVHRRVGPGLLESVYQQCLMRELFLRGVPFSSQASFRSHYKGMDFDVDYRMDLLVAEKVIVELKVVERLLPVHEAQLLSYLRLSGKKLGLLINFNVAVLKDGIKRVVNQL